MSFHYSTLWENHLGVPSEIHQSGLQREGETCLQAERLTQPFVENTKAQVHTGRKWDATKAVDQTITLLKHQDIVGLYQQGKAGFGWGSAPRMWTKVSRKDRKD